jgi:hypothetical protein
MLKLKLDFNSALSEFLGRLPSGSIATQELDLVYNGRSYRLTAVSRGKTHRLALRDEWGEACPGFEVVCIGDRLVPEEGEESIDLGDRSRLDLTSLHLYLEGRSLGWLQIVPEMPRLTPAEKDFAFEQRRAWQTLYQMRTCPPLEVLRQGSEEAEEHISACPSCKELLSSEKGDEAWADLARKLASNLPSPRTPPVRPGQIWTLRNDLEGWDAVGLYPRTPLVLVLSMIGGIQVAPVCPETSLAGERDVLLGEGFGFAESWNRFTLPPSSLRECLRTIENARLQEVLKQADETLPESTTDLRRAFENLERHAADTFEKRALAWDIAHTSKEIKRLDLSHWKNTFLETLRALFPVPSVGEAAVAADDTRSIPLQFFRSPLHQIEHCRASLTDLRSGREGVHVTGKLLLPEGVIPSLLYGWIKQADGDDVEATRADMAEHYFSLDFPGLENLDEKDLRLAAVCYGG